MNEDVRKRVVEVIDSAKQRVFAEMALLAGTTVTDETERDIAELHLLVPCLNIVKSAIDPAIPEAGEMPNQAQKNRNDLLRARAQESRARMIARAAGKKAATPAPVEQPATPAAPAATETPAGPSQPPQQ